MSPAQGVEISSADALENLDRRKLHIIPFHPTVQHTPTESRKEHPTGYIVVLSGLQRGVL
jgi:hypothetical protein